MTVGARGFRPQPMQLSPVARRLSLGVLGVYGLLAFVLPFLVLVFRPRRIESPTSPRVRDAAV